MSNERLNELALRKEELYREVYIHHRKPVDGLVEFLDAAATLGIKMAVATAASPPNMAFILDGLELRKYFGAITTAADVKRGKPDPEIFLLSAERLGVQPKNSIVFEDAFFGFEAAKRAGMQSVGLTTVNSAEEIMRTGTVVEVHSDYSSMQPGELVAKYLPV